MSIFTQVLVVFAVIVWAILLMLLPGQLQEGTLTVHHVVNILLFTANVVMGIFIIFELR